MVNVLIVPSYGNRLAQQHWKDTLDEEVDFLHEARTRLLSTEQRDALIAMHPTGKARFWGAVPKHDSRFDDVESYDVALFTGQGQIRAIGEVGVSFRNPNFAANLWPEQEDTDSWSNVYSLATFQRAALPDDILRTALGWKPNAYFQGFVLKRDEEAETILSALQLTPQATLNEDVEDARTTLARLGFADSHQLVERTLTPVTGYTRTERDIIVKRAESALVTDYVKSLPADHQSSSLRVASGVIDLHIRAPEQVDIIEAKSSSRHRKVREALGQILDYAHSVTIPVHRIAVLLPSAPTANDLVLLHHYGVDLIFRTEDGTFRRLDAEDSRQVWRKGS